MADQRETQAVSERNSLQVALRTGSSTQVLMTLVLQTTVFCTLLAGAIDVQGNRPRIVALIPSLLLLLYFGHVFCMAASITDWCASVLPLMNSFQSGIEMDTVMLHVVQFIAYNAAGIYVFGRRVATDMVLKLTS